MVSTDGAVGHPPPGRGHPQDAGTFPRFFQKMVREQTALTLTEAVKRCTLIPAKRLNLKGKGRLREGADADLIIFEPEKIADRADYFGFGRPDAPPDGISQVIVNGQIVVNAGKTLENVKPGRIIRSENQRW
jgi:N-acyl-D-amino-acid deacylase